MSTFTEEYFKLGYEDVLPETKNTTANKFDYYKPDPKTTKDGIYRATIRFVPWWKNPQHGNVVQHVSSWLVNPDTGLGKYIQGPPSNTGIFSPITKTFWSLYNSNNASEKRLSSFFRSDTYYFSLVQIISDENQPELEGKIVVFRFKKQIFDRLAEEIAGNVSDGIPKRQPFDLFKGRKFKLEISIRTVTDDQTGKVISYPQYDKCRFLEAEQPLLVDGEPIDETNIDYERVGNYLKEMSPDLEQFKFTSWDDETLAYIFDVIQKRVSNRNLIEDILKRTEQSVGRKIDITTESSITFNNTSSTSNVEMLPTSSSSVEFNSQRTSISDIDDEDDFDFDD